MELTVQNVYGLLLRSKLLSLEEAKALFARWEREAGGHATNLARFASWMVANKYLTEYQAGLLARGHADGFFLGDYKVLERLGKGRMAGVYKAQHRLGQVVAIKVLPPSKAKDATLLGRFQRESRLAMKLKHPNVVRAFQVGVAGGLNYLVMEYLEGETLEEVLTRRGKFLPGEAVRLVYQALQGLEHIHGRGLVHRDLKPSNLMLVPGPAADGGTLRSTVKILDIGLGRALFDEGGTEDPGLTGEGVLLGTPDYMAPEQARDPRAADIRSDVYSLGCVLYHLLAGHPPFPDTNIISQMIRHATEPPRPLKESNPAVPDGLQQIINWMLAKDPAGRYPTPERAAQALHVFLAAGSEPAHGPEADPKMRSYLTWLEVEDGKARQSGAPAAKPPSGTVPAAPAAKVVPPSTVAEHSKAPRANKPERPRHGTGKRRKKSRLHQQQAVPVAAPAVAVAAPVEINVELVPLPPSAAPGLRLGRRDFLFFTVGAAAGAVVTLLGWLIARLGKKEG
ncbi:MAG TPA: serine/threonine-protein kinase [Gemmataceae bacterium]|jgi:serine/threonine protein kinase|nr:serine/threonine-protein kinase [Gemmataceae bacterium]